MPKPVVGNRKLWKPRVRRHQPWRRVRRLPVETTEGTEVGRLGRRTLSCQRLSCVVSKVRKADIGPPIRTSEIGNLQQLAVADPGFGKLSLGLACRGGVSPCLMQFHQSEV
jgi:hypothetical protein